MSFTNYAKERGYRTSKEDRYAGYATYHATADLNQKMEYVIGLLSRLVELEEARATKEGYMPKPKPPPEPTVGPRLHTRGKKPTLPVGY